MNLNQKPSLLNADYEKTLYVKGESMFPFLREGDVLIIEPIKPKNLKIGDIVIFKNSNNSRTGDLVVHRLIRKQEVNGAMNLSTKGDNNLKYDLTVTENDFLGRVGFLLRGNKTISLKSRWQQISSFLITILSKSNLNAAFLKNSFFVRYVKKSNFFTSLFSFIFSKKIKFYSFEIPDGTTILKALSGNFCLASFEVEYSVLENLVLKNWQIKFPFYVGKLGISFLTHLISYCKESSKEKLIFEKLTADNPVSKIIEKMGLKQYSLVSQDGTTIYISKIPKQEREKL